MLCHHFPWIWWRRYSSDVAGAHLAALDQTIRRGLGSRHLVRTLHHPEEADALAGHLVKLICGHDLWARPRLAEAACDVREYQ